MFTVEGSKNKFEFFKKLFFYIIWICLYLGQIKYESMDTLDLETIIKVQDLDKKDLAEQLFPGNKYPLQALDRVLSGQGKLDSDQISKLSTISGIGISELYGPGSWFARSKDGIHTFTSGDYKAELNSKTWVTKIYHKHSMFHETVLHAGAVTLNSYLQTIDSIINKHKK